MDMAQHDGSVLKKVGEVYAFTQVGVDTFERGQEALERVFNEEDYEEVLNELNSLQESLDDFLATCDDKAIITEKAERTGAKLSNMRDLYINDEWDDSVELLEWLGFFQGAAIVHWGLIVGFVTGGAVSSLAESANQAITFHQNLLTRVTEILIATGADY